MVFRSGTLLPFDMAVIFISKVVEVFGERFHYPMMTGIDLQVVKLLLRLYMNILQYTKVNMLTGYVEMTRKDMYV